MTVAICPSLGCATRKEVDCLCEQAKQEDYVRGGPTDSGYPVGDWAFLVDLDGCTLEIAFGQEVALTVAQPEREASEPLGDQLSQTPG